MQAAHAPTTTPRVPEAAGAGRHDTLRGLLLASGAASSVLYVATDVICSLRWAGYSYRDQSISELGAIGAPTRPLAIGLLLVGAALVIAFGAGVWRFAADRRAMRVAAGLLIALGAWSLATVAFTPMHLRGEEATLTDAMHLAVTSVGAVLGMAAMAFAAAASGRRFRWYTVATVVAVLAFGAWAGADAQRVRDNLPTPWLGIRERVSVYAYQAWFVVFALALLRRRVADRLRR